MEHVVDKRLKGLPECLGYLDLWQQAEKDVVDAHNNMSNQSRNLRYAEKKLLMRLERAATKAMQDYYNHREGRGYNPLLPIVWPDPLDWAQNPDQ